MTTPKLSYMQKLYPFLSLISPIVFISPAVLAATTVPEGADQATDGATLNTENGVFENEGTTLSSLTIQTGNLYNTTGGIITQLTISDSTKSDTGTYVDNINGGSIKNVDLTAGTFNNESSVGTLNISGDSYLSNSGTIDAVYVSAYTWSDDDADSDIEYGLNNTDGGIVTLLSMAANSNATFSNQYGATLGNAASTDISITINSASSLSNYGKIVGVTLITGTGATLTNGDLGTIEATVTMTNGSVLNNLGAITGNISANASTINNYVQYVDEDNSYIGEIYGDISLSNGALLNNTAHISGTVTASGAGTKITNDIGETTLHHVGTLTDVILSEGAELSNTGYISGTINASGSGTNINNYISETPSDSIDDSHPYSTISNVNLSAGATMTNYGTITDLVTATGGNTSVTNDGGSIAQLIIDQYATVTNDGGGIIGDNSIDPDSDNPTLIVGGTNSWGGNFINKNTSYVYGYTLVTSISNTDNVVSSVTNSASSYIETIEVGTGGVLSNQWTSTIDQLYVTGGTASNESNSTINKATISSGTLTNGSAANTGYTTKIGTLIIEEGIVTNQYQEGIIDTVTQSAGSLTNKDGATITLLNLSGGSAANETSSLITEASITAGTLGNNGTITTITASGTDSVINHYNGTIETAELTEGASMSSSASITEKITISGTGENASGESVKSSLTNYGSIASLEASDSASVTNSGSITTASLNGGSIANYSGGTINNISLEAGLITNSGDVTNLTLSATATNANNRYTQQGDDTLESLTLEGGQLYVYSGTLTVNNIESVDGDISQILVEGGANLQIKDTTDADINTLILMGTVTAAGDLTIKENIQNWGSTSASSLDVEGKLTILNKTEELAGTAASITAASLDMQSGSLTLSDILELEESGASNTASKLSTNTLSMQESSTLNVTDNLQANKVVINADNADADSMAGATIITTESLTVTEGTTMTFVMTEAGLEQLGLTYDEMEVSNWMTLLYIEDGYSDASDFALSIGDVTVTDGNYYNLGYDGYYLEVVQNVGGSTSVNIVLKQVPEPSSTSLSLLALAILCAKRRRKKA